MYLCIFTTISLSFHLLRDISFFVVRGLMDAELCKLHTKEIWEPVPWPGVVNGGAFDMCSINIQGDVGDLV